MTEPSDENRMPHPGTDNITNQDEAEPKKRAADLDYEEFRRQGIEAGLAAIPQEMRDWAEHELDKLPEGYTPTPERPRKTLREVMADCVSALSLGPEDLTSMREFSAHTKKVPTTNPKQYPPEIQRLLTRLAQNESGIFVVLKANGLRHDTADEMKRIGLDNYAQEWWQQKVYPRIPSDDKDRLQSLLDERRALRAE